MGMNNVYYRFLHLSSNEKYKTMPARLRMNAIRTHGVDHADFELWCTAVSAINGCGACVDSHEKTLRDKGVAEEKILAAVRIASVVHAIASVLQTESALGNLVGGARRDGMMSSGSGVNSGSAAFLCLALPISQVAHISRQLENSHLTECSRGFLNVASVE